jgi:hypothetical protein
VEGSTRKNERKREEGKKERKKTPTECLECVMARISHQSLEKHAEPYKSRVSRHLSLWGSAGRGGSGMNEVGHLDVEMMLGTVIGPPERSVELCLSRLLLP